jgi:NADPH:quinone reductase-like Zn-dependent oxidoreductase
MRAAVVIAPGAPEAITVIDVAVPEPGPGEIRIDVAAAGVNPVDLGTRAGFFHEAGLVHQPEHTGLGWDVAGTVAATGPGVELPVGTRVAGIAPGFDRPLGTYAEQVVMRTDAVAVVPDGLTLVEAATVPVNGLAAAQALDLLGPAEGRTLLVTGAAGAVGGYALRLAVASGWSVTGLARAADEDFVRDSGAEFTDTPVGTFDAVLDGARLEAEAIALVRDGGSYVGTRPGGGPASERGVTTAAVETDPDARVLTDLLARTASGELPARVHAVLPLDRAADAHRALEKGGVRGRYVLRP